MKTIKKPQWCIKPEDKHEYPIGGCHADRTISKYIRCPRCNKRLKPMMIETEPSMASDLHAYVPPHKTRKKIKQ